MKRKILLSILALIGLFTITGCGKNKNVINNNGNSNENTGRIYNIINLQDKGINMFNGIVPKGWSAKIYSQDLVNSTHPFMETIVITNPDKTAKITIISQNSYLENKKYNEGRNKDYYVTYLHSMNAKEYSDYYMERIFKVTNFVEEKEVPQEMSLAMNNLHNIRMELAKKDAETLSTLQQGVNISVDSESSSVSKRIYEKDDAIYETTTGVSAISTTLTNNISSILDSKQIFWYIPYTITYEATSQENFDQYYDDYNFIIANSDFTLAYYQCIEYVSNSIVNAVTAAYAERSRIALEATNNYIDSNYSSTSSSSTNDKIMEMWDDVIKEQDNYILEDGSSIKTSIMNDTVAQNGDEIYIGSKAGIPNGFNELSKGY